MTTVATSTTVELLHFPGMESYRALQFMRLFAYYARHADVELVETDTYRGEAEWLVLWGPGAADRQRAMAAHVAAGKHAVAFDLAYWNRFQKVRVSIDAPHPQAWVMQRLWPDDRYRADGVARGELWKPKGPVVIAGIGSKAR